MSLILVGRVESVDRHGLTLRVFGEVRELRMDGRIAAQAVRHLRPGQTVEVEAVNNRVTSFRALAPGGRQR